MHCREGRTARTGPISLALLIGQFIPEWAKDLTLQKCKLRTELALDTPDWLLVVPALRLVLGWAQPARRQMVQDFPSLTNVWNHSYVKVCTVHSFFLSAIGDPTLRPFHQPEPNNMPDL